MTKQSMGDDQGTRVGAPDQSGNAAADGDGGIPSGRPERTTGAGSEASEGVHGAKGGTRPEGDRTALSGKESGRSADGSRAGSEPLEERENEHRSGYGGAGGAPVTSSDKR
ncbi:MAG: hypothetical protein H0W68_06435 [Gemmatimonadaceae bacterium]|nr:hypothetical protein [Gemmatimonadaceae bacterium]